MLPVPDSLIRLLAGTAVLSFLLAGCATPPPSGTEPAATKTGLTEARPPPPESTPSATAKKVQSKPEREKRKDGPTEVRPTDPAAAPVVARLARQLRIPEEDIEVLQLAKAEWPDTCLGLSADGEICGQVITPGYAMSLSANGRRYEYRTDASGSRARLATAPVEDPGNPLLTWRDSQTFNVLIVGTERVSFGMRGRPLLTTPLAIPARARELEEFLATFAGCQARTPAGEITLAGVGALTTGATEQRLLAEWARLVWEEADGGLEKPAADRALVWRREGGIAGICETVVIGRAGNASAWSCRGDEEKLVSRIVLTSGQLAQIYTWLDRFQSMTLDVTDGARADAITQTINIAAEGIESPSESDREAMIAFVNAVVRELLIAPEE